jgi:hypothetical protein
MAKGRLESYRTLLLHYIAVTAQGAPEETICTDAHAFKQIDTVLSWAVNKSTRFLRHTSRTQYGKKVPELEKYLVLPNVHLGIDPEFS